jgi:hypothetical protein
LSSSALSPLPVHHLPSMSTMTAREARSSTQRRRADSASLIAQRTWRPTTASNAATRSGGRCASACTKRGRTRATVRKWLVSVQYRAARGCDARRSDTLTPTLEWRSWPMRAGPSTVAPPATRPRPTLPRTAKPWTWRRTCPPSPAQSWRPESLASSGSGGSSGDAGPPLLHHTPSEVERASPSGIERAAYVLAGS